MNVGLFIVRLVVVRAWSDEPPDPGSHDHPCAIVMQWPQVQVRSIMVGSYFSS